MSGVQHACLEFQVARATPTARSAHRGLSSFWSPAFSLWDKSDGHFSRLGLSPSRSSQCQVLEAFSHHSQQGINSLQLIYRDGQGTVPAESVILSFDFSSLPVPREAPPALKIVLTPRNSPSHCRFKLVPSWPPGLCIFFLIFKEAYLQGEGKVSQRDGGGRENEPSIC